MESNDDNTRTHIALTKGTMVSHYRIVEKIGAGGMGEVYLAEDSKLKRRVALKFMPTHLASDAEMRARFTREAQAAAKLDHPNIVPVYEVGEFHNRPFIAMAHIQGQSLRDVIKRGKLTIPESIELTLQICDGLNEAHNAGVIHRDIKPGNIIIDSKCSPRILDFGLAKVTGEDRLTKTGSTMGTVGYMSPEQIESKEVDNRADLFSIGVILYEMITCRHPFEGDNDAAVVKAIADSTPEPIARFKSGVTSELQQVISKALAKDPSMRYQSAAGVISDLKLLISLTKTFKSGAPFLTKNKWSLAIGVLVVVAVLMGAYTIYRSSSDIEHPTNSAHGRMMLAVLPFENLGSEEDDYFADGITDEITSRLASVSGLGVISRTSAVQYKNTEKSLPDIAKELGVDYILEGTIRWDKAGDTNRVRITPQLIDVSDNTHMWGHSFERALIKIFEVQEEIALQVVERLNITLLDPERQIVESESTDNLDAYDLYLRAKWYASRSYKESDYLSAIILLEKALEFDSEFSDAYALLAYAHTEMYWFRYDRTRERLASAKLAIDRAVALAPNDQDVLMGEIIYNYHGLRDFEKSLRVIEQLIKINPSNPDSYKYCAAIKRRQGKWEEALQYYEKREVLDPRNAMGIWELASTHRFMYSFPEAEVLLKRSISVAPDVSMLYEDLADLYIDWDADTEKSRQFVLDNADRIAPDAVQAHLAQCDIYEKNYYGALGKLSRVVFGSFGGESDFYRTKASVYGLIGDSVQSRIYYDSMLQYVESQSPQIKKSLWAKKQKAFALAGLGRKQEAIKLVGEAVELMPISEDALSGSNVLYAQAMVFIEVGEYVRGLTLLDSLLSRPALFSINTVKVLPYFESVRTHPLYLALLKKHDLGNRNSR